MSQEESLSNLYRNYNQGVLVREDFQVQIFQYLLGNIDRYRFIECDRNRWNDFLSWLYPRIARAIDLYRDLGSSFDAYVSGLLHRASKEYRLRETERRITEYAFWQERAQEIFVCESEVEYPEPRKEVNIPKGIRPKQILLLLLKSYYFASDEFVQQVSRAIGIKAEEVMGMIEKLKMLRAQKEINIAALRDRLHCQHYRCLAYERRMNAAASGSACREKMKCRWERARQRFLSMRKRLERMRVDASNRMIADVLGIPKGTVDSCLFAVRNHLAGHRNKRI